MANPFFFKQIMRDLTTVATKTKKTATQLTQVQKFETLDSDQATAIYNQLDVIAGNVIKISRIVDRIEESM